MDANHDEQHGHGHDHGDHRHAPPTTFIRKYVFSTDHKVIGMQFTFAALLFVILGGLLALGVRYELAWPQQNVPHHVILPGDMTSEAPEANLAHWSAGSDVVLRAPLTVDGTEIPANAVARFTGFPNGLAVTIPAGTRVEPEGASVYTTPDPIDGFVDHAAVMGDYNYKAQQGRYNLQAIPGTVVRLPATDGRLERRLRLAGVQRLRPGPTGQPVVDVDTRSAILLPIDATKTNISLQLPSRIVDRDGNELATLAAPVTVDRTPAGSVAFLKQVLKPEAYLQLFTMHASIMIFFVIIPMLVGGFGNFLIPLMIGARDMAFPKLNALAFWIAVPAGVLMLISFWTHAGPAAGGWTMYPTLSGPEYARNIGTTMWVMSVGLVGFSSVIGALNYITTVINMRAPGMSMFRMPLTVWSLFITSLLALFATPVLTAAMIMLTFDRVLGTMFFLPQEGGQPLMWQHLFWFYSHPAVYIMILPAMGVTSDILSTFARKPIFGYKPMVFAMAAITGLGFIVWGHHMFQSGMNPVLGTTFMASTIMIAVPSAIKTFNWLGTLWGGNIQFTPAMLNALAFVSMFVIGGLSGIFMASAPVDIYIHDTYFIVAHIHYVLFGGSLFGIFAGIYYWFPKMFGRQMNQKWGVIHFVLTFIAFNGTFFLMHILGVGGHPRRYASIMEYPQLLHLQPMNVFMTLWAMALGMAQIPFLYNFFASLPGKVRNGVLSLFAVVLVTPALMGTMFWSMSQSAGGAGFGSTASTLGFIMLLLAMIGIIAVLVRGFEGIGRMWVLLMGLPVVVYVFAAYTSTLSPVERGQGDPTALDASLMVLRHLLWSPQTQEVIVVTGYGALAAAVLVAAILTVLKVGEKLRVASLLHRLLYLITLPAFLSPFLFKKDAFLWLGVPQWHEYAWLLLALSAVPGLLYLLMVRPKDAFGHETTENPWHANSLEWATASPPVHDNFPVIPTVYRGAYEFSSPVVEDDYLPQVKPLPAGVVEPSGH